MTWKTTDGNGTYRQRGEKDDVVVSHEKSTGREDACLLGETKEGSRKELSGRSGLKRCTNNVHSGAQISPFQPKRS